MATSDALLALLQRIFQYEQQRDVGPKEEPYRSRRDQGDPMLGRMYQGGSRGGGSFDWGVNEERRRSARAAERLESRLGDSSGGGLSSSVEELTNSFGGLSSLLKGLTGGGLAGGGAKTLDTPLDMLLSGGLMGPAFGVLRHAAKSGLAGTARIAGSLGKESPFGGAAEIVGGMGDIGAGIPIYGKHIQSVAKFGEAVLHSIDRLKTWSEGLHEGNMRFAEFSGVIAGINARMQVNRILLDIERGHRRADIAQRQMESRIRAEREFEAPLQDMWDRVKGKISSTIDDIKADIGEKIGLREMATGMGGGIVGAIGGALGFGDEHTEWLKEAAGDYNQEIMRRYGRPPQFRGP